MSREIKFRARCTKDTDYIDGGVVCRMLKGEFIYGWLTDGFIIQHKQPFPIDQNTIGQFTGLTDKHGKEIYEGDLYKHQGSIGAIKFAEGCYFVDHPRLWGYSLPNINDGEVIGNIYENPDLMQFNK